MKNLLLAALFSLGLFTAQAQTTPAATPNPNGAQVTFEETSHDFGDIVQGQVVTYTFHFKNTGKEPLILSNVMTTCGCTASTWPKEPIAPGKKSEIVATFNSAGKSGKQNKVITVLSNAVNNSAQVSIISNVVPKPAEAAPSTTPAAK